MMLIAQVTDTLWEPIIRALSMNGIWIFLGICVLAGTAKHIVEAVMRHRERIAMIESGMDPDGKESKTASMEERKRA